MRMRQPLQTRVTGRGYQPQDEWATLMKISARSSGGRTLMGAAELWRVRRPRMRDLYVSTCVLHHQSTSEGSTIAAVFASSSESWCCRKSCSIFSIVHASSFRSDIDDIDSRRDWRARMRNLYSMVLTLHHPCTSVTGRCPTLAVSALSMIRSEGNASASLRHDEYHLTTALGWGHLPTSMLNLFRARTRRPL